MLTQLVILRILDIFSTSVKSYDISPISGVACVEFHTGSNAVVGKELTDDEIAALSVVAMSGSVAEIMEYGKATGGENDLLELQNCFMKCKEFIGAAKQQDLTRWGALTSYGLIKTNLSKYEVLVKAFKENKSLSDCVAIIESSAQNFQGMINFPTRVRLYW